MNNIPEIKTLEDLKNFLAYNKIEEKWRNCKRKKYNIYACKMSEGFIFANCLEQGAFYKYLKEQFGRAIVLKEQVSFDDIRNKFGLIPNETLYSSGKGKIVLCGTRGELWTVKEEKLASSYTNVDGSPIDLSKLKEDKWFEVSRAQEDEPHAKGVFIPSNFSFKYNAWGQILTINDRYSKGHYKGDIFVVETDANGNLNWNGSKSPTNSEAFSLTYDLTVGGWAQTGLLKKVEEIEPYNTKNIQEDYPIYTKEERANIINEKHKQIEEKRQLEIQEKERQKQQYLNYCKNTCRTISEELNKLTEELKRVVCTSNKIGDLNIQEEFNRISFNILKKDIDFKKQQLCSNNDVSKIGLVAECLLYCTIVYALKTIKKNNPSLFMNKNRVVMFYNSFTDLVDKSKEEDLLDFEYTPIGFGFKNSDEKYVFMYNDKEDKYKIISGDTSSFRDFKRCSFGELFKLDEVLECVNAIIDGNASKILNTSYYKQVLELLNFYFKTELVDVYDNIENLIENLKENYDFKEKKKFDLGTDVFTLTNGSTYNVQFKVQYYVNDQVIAVIKYKVLDVVKKVSVMQKEVPIPNDRESYIEDKIRMIYSSIVDAIQE